MLVVLVFSPTTHMDGRWCSFELHEQCGIFIIKNGCIFSIVRNDTQECKI